MEHTHSSIGYLVLEALGVSDEDSEYAVSHSGVAAGIATLLRALPHHASQVRRNMLRGLGELAPTRGRGVAHSPLAIHSLNY